MSYTLQIENPNEENYENLTANWLSDETISNTDQFTYWFEEDMDQYESIEEAIDEGELMCDLVSMFQDSVAYSELMDSLWPAMYGMEVLSCVPSKHEVNLLFEINPTVTIGKLIEFDAYVIGLSGGGMDLTDCLELAYYVIDGRSPIESSQIMTVDEGLLEACRKERDDHGYVHIDFINKYINKKEK
ncbi:MAG: hypothetical protein DRN17_05635 [Thermoplasmata archaeon]|nr:MAG: hypothetical protein DRN17_05635 [Thermoplasmata archaeon]